jgi:hypothetical protein
MLAKTLDVCHEMIGGVDRKIDPWLVGERRAASAATLVKQHSPKPLGIEVAASANAATAPRTTVQIDDRHARRVTHSLPVQRLAIADR